MNLPYKFHSFTSRFLIPPSSTSMIPAAVTHAGESSALQNWIHGAVIGTDVLFIVALLVSFVRRKRRTTQEAVTATSAFTVFLYTCCLYLVAVNVTTLIWLGFENWHHLRPSLFLAQVSVQALAWLCAFLTLTAARRRPEQRLSPVVRVWWLVSSLINVVQSVLGVLHLLSETSAATEKSLAVTSLVSLPASLLLLVASIRGKTGVPSTPNENDLKQPLLDGEVQNVDKKGEDEVTPYSTAGFWSVLLFNWISPLLAVGAKRTLEPEDVPQLDPRHRSSTVYSNFHERWEKAKLKDGGKPSLFKTLVECFWKRVVAIGVLVTINSVAAYVGPYLIDDFVSYLSGIRRFKNEGLILAVVFLGAKLVENFTQRHWFLHGQIMGMEIRSALTACVYRKGLRLSNPSRQSHTSGEIVNYMAVDIQRVNDFTWYIYDIWLLPLQLVVALGILYSKVGMAVLATVLATVVSIGANTPFSRMQERFQDKIMEAKDVRMRATTECLKSMKILKLQAWEKAYLKKLEEFRDVEYGWLVKSFIAQSAIVLLFWTTPMLVGLATFGTCVLLKIPLTTGRVLSALATFRILQEPLSNFPDFISMLAQARVSASRIQSFLNEKELQTDAVSRLPKSSGGGVVTLVENGEFSWDDSPEKITLSDINLSVREGMTVAVCGVVGSGKSSLLSCLLGEIPKLSGNVHVKGTTAYVSQTAWIQSGKIEDNVLFGKAMDRRKYDDILEICQLKKDLEVLPYGDQTEIGERGINLSGGQKQRIQLARAMYQDADIYLLDDPFSAVDVQTGSQIFKECVLGTLASKTIILVTHQIEFVPAADLILVLKNGRITQAGTYDELLEEGSDFTELVGAHNKAMEVINHAEKSGVDVSVEGILDNEEKDEKEEKEPENKTHVDHQQLVQEEEREKGSVGLKVYWDYCTAVYKGALVPCILLANLCFQLCQIGSNWWMASETPTTSFNQSGGMGGMNPSRLITGYAIFAAGATLCVLVRSILLNIIGLFTAQKFFYNMLHALFHAPMSFFDSTPTGRILSRASTDQSAVDLNVPYRVAGAAFSAIQLLCVAGVMSQVSWQVFIVFIPVFAVCVMLQRYYIASGRELSRLQGVQKAPIIHHYAESIAGAPTVRGFGQEERFLERNLVLIDSAARAIFHANAAMEWVSLRLELLTNVVFSFCLILLLLLPPGTISPSMAGLAVTYGLNLNVIQSWFIWNLCTAEQKIVSVERILQYTTITSEAPWEVEATKPPESWPVEGNVELVELKVRYNATAPFVLHGLSCKFPGGKKVGVVGRTGSGKSTLIQAIFRIVEPVGKIVIDGVDITQIGLHDLRSKLSIIPQDPTMFEGTIRYNLDPLGQYTDSELWEALDNCQLGDLVRSKAEKLESAVTENGENWSVGQRQLFCLGRVMLKRSRVLVLDEATASVDSATDGVIQATIANKFVGCTVITIAHRLPTVVDSDFVLVLNDGRVAEYDKPAKLLESSSSHFHKLVSEYSQRAFGFSKEVSS